LFYFKRKVWRPLARLIFKTIQASCSASLLNLSEPLDIVNARASDLANEIRNSGDGVGHQDFKS
jgi:hypothetical protein